MSYLIKFTVLSTEHSSCYPDICRIGHDTEFTVYFFVSLFVYIVTDFSVRTLPIDVKFCVMVWPDLRQAFSYFGGIAPGMTEFWASTGRRMAGYASC